MSNSTPKPSSEWVASAVAAVPTRDANGALLTGRPLLICQGMKKLMRVVSEWQVETNTTKVEWTYTPQYYRNVTNTGLITVLQLRHEDEAHDFKMEADWVTDTTTAEKMECCICPPPQRISTGA